jgi:hypothetical protein
MRRRIWLRHAEVSAQTRPRATGCGKKLRFRIVQHHADLVGKVGEAAGLRVVSKRFYGAFHDTLVVIRHGAVDALAKRCFTRAVFPHDGDEFALMNLNADLCECPFFCTGIMIRNVIELNNGVLHAAPP